MTLMSLFQSAGEIGMALAIAVGAIAVLFSPIVLGRVIGRRTNGRVQLVICAALAVVALIGARDLVHDFQTHFADASYWSMAVFFAPIYVALGIVIGSGHRSEANAAEKRLATWRAQLETDRANGAVPQRLVIDYREIAALLNSLGRRQEAAAEYRQAVAIAELSMSGHPGMVEFYNGYLALLRRKQDPDEIARIKEKLNTLTKI